MYTKRLNPICAATLAIAASLPMAAHADDPDNIFRIGYAHVGFDLKSSDLTGPPGTTPPGLRINVKDLDILALSYERRLSPNWGVQFQAGIPPTLTTVGAGAAVPVGTVAKARIWFPTVLARYTFTGVPTVRPYVGVGVTYTFFTDEEVTTGYTAALQGSSSSMKLEDSWSPYVRLGVEYPIDKNWIVNVEYSTFQIKSTATVVTQTPGLGPIPRRVDIKDTPQIFGVTIGYRF
ncbi:OmpW [Rhodoferax ferrireducens T118]|uniref:OmpW n=1 Tax=Albidiferax ferrireducens (strain ATCC BAA-621 / DSM 15236 / T118) TaxID=338969 RepID=Q222I0_ALBFT|nr:OmpW family outer membrane protein [Rhodoferax ferrireducens]ABD68073.1 OmpW [Rhodoferax ferrireducens T118]